MTGATRALFDRTAKGFTTSTVEVEVERGRIRFFAQALGETDPAHTDLEAARARGYPDLIAPPAFVTVLDSLANEALARRGEPSVANRIGANYAYLLHGDEHYQYLGPIFAGDALTLTTTVDDFYEKRGGLLEFAALSSRVVHAERGLLVAMSRTLIHRFG